MLHPCNLRCNSSPLTTPIAEDIPYYIERDNMIHRHREREDREWKLHPILHRGCNKVTPQVTPIVGI